MEITAKMVSELREKTGAGMMKCKEALIECKGNFEEAIDYLRKKGLASADNKAGRAASQGLIVAKTSPDRRTAVLLETNCETDFVARNAEFVSFTGKLADAVLATPTLGDLTALANHQLEGRTVDEIRKGLVAKIGENIQLGRVQRLTAPATGVFDTYIHGEGKLGVVIQLDCSKPDLANQPATIALAHEIALQVAAMNPFYPTRQQVPANVLAKEKEIILGQLQNDPKNAKKPQNILEKIVEGRLDKFYKERCLVEQVYVKDDTKTIQDLLTEYGKAHDATVTVTAFWRWAVGERPAETAPSSCCGGATGCCS
ncbi:MAG: Translation elongation factor Ts [Candidatus Ozemobacter sibiricus]|uniref:Elongation factor Ts n=1 Tax=Candidatus Ozemobacter sibiricus TaxID=2268124 RepID=A0A367ZQN4_9BACT|nr:MAG: Translation elongation factor Ts [Candidatus Ozemobacter sibiricus]